LDAKTVQSLMKWLQVRQGNFTFEKLFVRRLQRDTKDVSHFDLLLVNN